MPKSKFIPLSLFHHSPERIKGVNTVLPPKLDPLDKEAILARGNKVNGRDFGIHYIEKIITEMYPRIASFATPTPQKAPNPSPVQRTSEKVANTAPQPAIQAAPEVAPPPIISNTFAPEAIPKAPEQYQNSVQAPKPTSQVNQELPQSLPNLSEAQEKQAYIEASRAKVLQSYADGEEAVNSTQAVNRQAQEFINPPSDELTQTNVRLAA